MRKTIFFLSLLIAQIVVFAQNKQISVTTELKRLYDIQQLPQFIPDTHEWEKSSYDTTGGNDDGFSGRYSFVRRNPDSTLVIFEAKGKGVINRIWMPTHVDDTLDFYFDGKDKPGLSIKFYDLFSGKVFPFIHPLCGNQLGGYFCYVPIPFQNGCKIVIRAKRLQFYQIQCRSYPDDYDVKTFNPQFSPDEIAELVGTTSLWNKATKTVDDFFGGAKQVADLNITIKPGQIIPLLNLATGGRIIGMEISPASTFSGLNKQLDLKVTWDNEKTPAIYAPLADFFGYAFGSPSMQSLLLGSANDKNYCYFPMPFDNAAKVELIYRTPEAGVSAESKTIHAKIYYTTAQRNAATEGKFYAHWFNDIKPATGKPHVYLDVKGKGHYIGTILQAQGLNPGMTLFFEGDDSTSTDGITRIHGTGSEDSFNGGWYALLDRWDTKMSLPLHGALDYSLPFARTGGYRLYLNDKLSFSNHIFHSIEHGPEGNAIPVDYTSLALYYSDTPPVEVTAPTNQLSQVYIPDTLIMYPQLMKFSFLDKMDVNPEGNGFTFTSVNDNRMAISLAEMPHGRYKLYADIETNPNGAEVSFWQRYTQLSDWMSVNSRQTEAKKHVYLCDLTIDELKNTLSIVFKTKGDNNKLKLDRLIFEKQ